jgi:parvulin-like peptidyl-prolyl isomerase
MRLLVAALASLAVAAAGSAYARAAEVPKGAVAVVAGQAIPHSLYEAELNRRRHSYRLNHKPFPRAGTRAFRALRDSVVALLVWRIELRVGAAELGVAADPTDIERRLNQIRQQWGSNERQFQRELRKLGLTAALLRADIAAQLTTQALYDRFRVQATVTDDEVEAYYDRNLSAFTTPPSRDVQDLSIRSRALALRLYRELRAGASFDALARRYSTDRNTGRHGGRMTVYLGQGEALFVNTAFRLPTGGLSRPLLTKRWHLIRALSDARPPVVASLPEVAGAIKEAIKSAKASARLADWTAETKARFAPTISYAVGFAPE